MEQVWTQRRRIKAKEALSTLCNICDKSGSGSIRLQDFKAYMNQVQIHLSEQFVKVLIEEFCAPDGCVNYQEVIKLLDWNLLANQWVLLGYPTSSQVLHHIPMRKEKMQGVLQLMCPLVSVHKLQKYRVDLRVLQAVKEQFLRLDTGHEGKVSAEQFEMCLSAGANKLPENVRKLIIGFCRGSSGTAELGKLGRIMEEFIYTPQVPAFMPGKTTTLCLESPGYPIEGKLRRTAMEALQLEIGHKVRSRTTGLFAAFKFFDVNKVIVTQTGTIHLPDLVTGVRKLGIKAEESDIEQLLSTQGGASGLTLSTFSDLFGEGRPASLSPTPRKPLLPMVLS